jgi:FkbM family methyltransferase
MNFDRALYINQPIVIEQELTGLFKQNEAITIFEIGACEGEDSIKYSRLFPNSKIYAFEPLPQNIQLIQDNLAKYKISNVFYFNTALSNHNGSAEFFVSEGRPKNAPQGDWDYGNKSSSLLPPGEHTNLIEFIEFNKKIIVETITLKSFCQDQNISVIDFIHMDVQGAELMVMEGAKDFINRIKVVWLEVSKVELYKNQPLVREVEQFMSKHNFILIKDAVGGIQGDQLYISKEFFPDYKKLDVYKKNKKQNFLFRVLKKLKFTF